eukprot:55459-Amphidinium_carterae.1
MNSSTTLPSSQHIPSCSLQRVLQERRGASLGVFGASGARKCRLVVSTDNTAAGVGSLGCTMRIDFPTSQPWRFASPPSTTHIFLTSVAGGRVMRNNASVAAWSRHERAQKARSPG